MPETRVVETVYGVGGYDPSKPNNNIIEEVTAEISDEQLAVEAVEQETNQANDQALASHQNYDSLTKSEKDDVLKMLLGDYIIRNRDRYM